MTIEDLKTLMDEFDPSVLLPELDTMLGRMEFLMRIAVVIGPVILLIMGILYLFLSPKEANRYFGYRCYFGMGSVEAWRFTQRLAGIAWAVLGLVLTAVMLFLSGSFHGMQVLDMLQRASRCVISQVIVVAVSCLVINSVAAIRYDSKGMLRGKK